MSYSTPYDYRSGVPAGNAIAASGGFAESFIIKRFTPNNGTDFRLGSRISVKIADAECIWHPNQSFLKWKPIAMTGNAPYTSGGARAAVSGKTSSIKNATLSYSGKTIEQIQNYNAYCAAEYINAPLEHKMYLEKTEGLSFFTNGEATNDNRASFFGKDSSNKDINGQRYAMHQLQFGTRGVSSLELPLLPSGVDLELQLTTDLKEPYPVPDTIDNELWQNVEVVCVFTRPKEGFWTKVATDLQKGKVIHRPYQSVRYQSYQPTNSTSFSMTVDSGVVKSVSSILVCGRDPSKTFADKLSYSSDLGIRSISFSVAGKRVPEGKAISYYQHDPELYVLGFRGRDFENMAFVPSMDLFDHESTIGTATLVRGWQFRLSLKDVLSAYGDGLSTLTGSFQINLSTIPEGPDYLATEPAKLEAEKSFDVWYVTDQVMEISANGLTLTPVW